MVRNDWQDYLCHHGILGQKWGVRRFQNEDGTRTTLGKLKNNAAKTVQGIGNELAARAKKGVLEPLERREHINAYKFSDIKRMDRLENQVYTMAAVNPDYGKRLGTTMNCTLCAVAYEMRRRGYDVEANESEVGRDADDIAAMFSEVEDQYKDLDDEELRVSVLSKDELIADLENNMPEGARGFIGACFGEGDNRSLHCVSWEKIGNNIIIFDSQSNESYSIRDSRISNSTKVNGLYFAMRTDVMKLDEKKVMDAVKPRRQ